MTFREKKKNAFDATYKKHDLWVIRIRSLMVFGQYIYKTFIMYILLGSEIPVIGIYPPKKNTQKKTQNHECRKS